MQERRDLFGEGDVLAVLDRIPILSSEGYGWRFGSQPREIALWLKSSVYLHKRDSRLAQFGFAATQQHLPQLARLGVQLGISPFRR